MPRQRTRTVVLVALAIVVSSFAGFATLAGTATAGHGIENGNYTVDLPFDTDHYPRDENPGGPANASINHYAGFTKEQFDKKGAPKGVEELDWIIIDNQDIDFSECKTENTAAFGIDRDSDDPGTKTDVDLLQYRKDSSFNEHSIVIEFFDGDELAAPSPEDKGGPGEEPWKKGQGREDGDGNAEVYPDDQIVAHQGYKSGGGACYQMPEEPGWYQIHAYGNGTAFNGERVEVNYNSHYFYICKCDSRQDAIDTLGPPPSAQSNEDTGGATATPTDTPTDTPTATATRAPDTATAAPDTATRAPDTATRAPDDTATAARDTPTDSPTPQRQTATRTRAGQRDQRTATRSGGGGGNTGGGGGGNTGGGGGGNAGGAAQASQPTATATALPTTPTIAEGPGFGPALALLALLGAALLALRRD